MKRLYFDYAATSLSADGNPSSKYTEGKLAKKQLEDARSKAAAVLGCLPEQLYWTSGGTESNALVIHSFGLRLVRGTNNLSVFSSAVVSSDSEHPSVRENIALLSNLLQTDFKAVPASKIVSLCSDDTQLVCLMAVNNETGGINDVQSICSQLHAVHKRIHIHVDAVQALGKIPVNLAEWDCNSAAFSAHKIGGPRGIGLLYLRKPLEVVYRGGGQEKGIRSGTENTAGAVAFAECIERYAGSDLQTQMQAATERMQKLISTLQTFPRCHVLPVDRVSEGASHLQYSPWIVQVSIDGIPGEVMVRVLDDAGIAVSTGSACSNNKKERAYPFEGIRISQGYNTSMQDIDALCAAIKDILCKL
ncbi:MAG: aminotransferase class V-fold PLP-dependent enzyme [Spirochaetaceae bacterium]|jgi:cysteine desulfurase|nr:aminotransferase class V-fold PLP-dependent enzyme [Spirochaetaceae bacterium]